MNTEIKLGKLKLKNPVILASGTFDRAITKHIDVSLLGAITTKTITLQPKIGNPLPHIIKTEHGWLNSVGLKNIGIKKYLTEELPFWQSQKAEIITSIGGEKAEDFSRLASMLQKTDVSALEINLSCPNIKEGGLSLGTDPKTVSNITKNVKKIFGRHVIVKLTPNVTDIKLIAKSALTAGADSLTIANCYLALQIDNKKKKPIFHRIVGGYSGPAIKPISLRMVWETYHEFNCPVIGTGGIVDFNDVLDYIMIGATAVSIGSANFTNPKLSLGIITELKKYMNENKIQNLDQIRGII